MEHSKLIGDNGEVETSILVASKLSHLQVIAFNDWKIKSYLPTIKQNHS